MKRLLFYLLPLFLFSVPALGDTLTLSGTASFSGSGSIPWSMLTGTPTTISGYGISDGVTLTGSQSLTNKSIDGVTLAGTGTLNVGSGGTLGSAAFTSSGAYQTPLTFSTGLTNSSGTITANVVSVAGRTGAITLAPSDLTGLGSNVAGALTTNRNAHGGLAGFDANGLLSRVGLNSTGVANAGTGTDVWIAIRTDGATGSGTQDDPFDGSTEAKFDAIFTALSGTSNVTFHLGAGTFETDDVPMNQGWKLSGSGIDKTIVQLAPGLTRPNYDAYVIAQTGADSNQVIQDLTVDGNISNETLSSGSADSAICINGRVSRVKVINCGTLTGGSNESFWIFVNNTTGNTCYDDLIEDSICVVSNNGYNSYMTIEGGTDAVFRNDKVVSSSPTTVYPGHAFTPGTNTCVVENCYSDGIETGFYVDTGTMLKTIIRNNTFIRCRVGVAISNAGSLAVGGVVNQPSYYSQSLIIANNMIEVDPPAYSADCNGITFWTNDADGVDVHDNYIRMTPNTLTAINCRLVGITAGIHSGYFYQYKGKVHDNTVDLPYPNAGYETDPQYVLVNYPGAPGDTGVRPALMENGIDYENNRSGDNSVVVGLHHSRYTFYASAAGWYDIFNKETTNHRSGRISIYTYPTPSGSMGTGTLTAGGATISSSQVQQTSQIIITPTAYSDTPGIINAACANPSDGMVPGTAFLAASMSLTDSSSFHWLVLNGGTLAGTFNFDQGGTTSGTGTLTQLAAADNSSLSTVDQVRTYATSAYIQSDVHVTAPSKIIVEYDSDNDYDGYFENLDSSTLYGGVVSSLPGSTSTVNTLTFNHGPADATYEQATSNAAIATNSTTFASTPLAVTLGTGTWDIDEEALASATSTMGGVQLQWVFSGTLSDNGWLYDVCKDTSANFGSFQFYSQFPVSNFLTTPVTSNGLSLSVRGHVRVVVTTPGTLTLQVAETAMTSGQSAGILKGSYIHAHRVQ